MQHPSVWLDEGIVTRAWPTAASEAQSAAGHRLRLTSTRTSAIRREVCPASYSVARPHAGASPVSTSKGIRRWLRAWSCTTSNQPSPAPDSWGCLMAASAASQPYRTIPDAV